MNSYNGFSPAQRRRALAWSKREEAAGRRRRPTICEACGQTEGIIERHSEDYSEPFGDHIGQYSLCFCCHMHVHCRHRFPFVWQRYKRLVGEGFCYQAFHRRNFALFSSIHLHGSRRMLGAAVAEVRSPPARRVLDEIEAVSKAVTAAAVAA